MAAGPFLFVLMVLTVYRVYRLVGLDTITEPLRRRVKPDGRLGDFLTCPWCAGFWISAAVVLVIDHWYVALPLPALWVLGVSCVVGLIGSNLDG